MELSLETLQALRNAEAPWWVSITLPTARGSEDPRLNEARLRRGLAAAHEGLKALAVREDLARLALRRGEDALDDPRFWNPSARGLALFLSPGESVTDWLPVPVPEHATVGKTPRLVPIFATLAPETKFFVLAMAAHDVRLFEASKTSVRACLPDDLPRHIDEALPENKPEPSRQVVSAAGPHAAGIHYAHGPGDARNQDERLARFFRKVDESLREKLRGESAPLVLAGDVTVTPIYRAITDYPHVLEGTVDGNPEPLRGEELRDRAWPLVEPLVRRRVFDAVESLRSLEGSGRTAHDLGTLARLAETGGIERLFLTSGLDTEDESLDRIVLFAAAAGATVTFVEPGHLPDRHVAAAVLRKGHEYLAAAS